MLRKGNLVTVINEGVRGKVVFTGTRKGKPYVKVDIDGTVRAFYNEEVEQYIPTDEEIEQTLLGILGEDDEEMVIEDKTREEIASTKTEKKGKKGSKTATAKKEEVEKVVEEKAEKQPKKNNSNNKYWETESPILCQTDSNEIRYYEEAGKFQIFKRINRGNGVGHGVTIDVAEISEKEAMKVVANLIYAFKGAVHDDRFEKAIDLLEDFNEEINTEDYVWDRAELEGKKEEHLRIIAKNMGVKIKLKNKKHVIDTILERQEIIQADAEMEEEE